MSVNIDHGSSFEGDRDLWVNLGGAGRKDWELELWHDFSLPVSRLRPCLATPFSRPRWVRSFSSAPPKTPLDFRMSEGIGGRPRGECAPHLGRTRGSPEPTWSKPHIRQQHTPVLAPRRRSHVPKNTLNST